MRSVRVDNAPASFTRDGQELVVTPNRGLDAGSTFTVAVDYGGSPQTFFQTWLFTPSKPKRW